MGRAGLAHRGWGYEDQPVGTGGVTAQRARRALQPVQPPPPLPTHLLCEHPCRLPLILIPPEEDRVHNYRPGIAHAQVGAELLPVCECESARDDTHAEGGVASLSRLAAEGWGGMGGKRMGKRRGGIGGIAKRRSPGGGAALCDG